MVYNLASLLEDSAHRVPERDAIILGEMSLSYARLDGAANQVANLLVSRGVAPGDKVALSCPNIPSFTIVYFGILKAGATVVPLNVLLKGREVAYHLRDSESKAYLCFQGTPELPIGAEGYAGFSEVESCEHFVVITTDPAAMRAQCPISILPRIFAPAPIITPRRIFGWRSSFSLPVPPSVTSCRIETSSSITAVSPTTKPVA